MTPYSSVVKKTSGGPSGSLTSEGTEYDESSGEEAAQEDGGEVDKLPVVSSVPASGKEETSQQVSAKPVVVPVKSVGVRAQDPSSSSARNPVSSSAGLTSEHSTGALVQVAGVPSSSSKFKSQRTQEAMVPAVTPQRHGRQDSPYLERELPRASSQPEDAWPLIDEDHKVAAAVPLAVTASILPPPSSSMIYAAVMTNRSHQEQVSSTAATSTTPITHYTYSTAIPDNKMHFPQQQGVFSTHHATKAASLTSSPKPPLPLPAVTVPYLARTPPQQPMGDGTSHARSSVLQSPTPQLPNSPFPARGGIVPGRNQFHSSAVPSPPMSASYHHLVSHNFGGHAGNEVYSNAPMMTKDITSNSSSYQGGYNSGRSPRVNESVTTTTNPPPSLLPYSTVAAGMEVRSMLGIHGGRSTHQPIYTESSGFRAFGAANKSSSHTQTPRLPPVRSKAVQVKPEMVPVGLQTSDPEKTSSHTQTTSDQYVPMESLMPPLDARVDSLGMK